MEQHNLFWPCVEIRSGANRKHATEDESEDKRGNNRKQRHGQHIRSSVRMFRPSCRFDARRLAVVPLSSSCSVDSAGHRSRQGSRQKSEREGRSANERRQNKGKERQGT
jgi:hypothetical protein